MRLSAAYAFVVALSFSLTPVFAAGFNLQLYDVQLQTPDVDARGALVLAELDCGACPELAQFKRVYHSAGISHDHAGWFGYGWASPYEDNLQFQPDGTILAYDYGVNSAIHQFRTPRLTRSVAQISNEVMAAARRAHVFASSQARRVYAEALGEPSFRNAEWTKYLNAGEILVPQPPIGTELQDTTGQERLVRLSDGYQRLLANDQFAAYGNVGSYNNSVEAPLIRQWDKAHHFVSIQYDSRQTVELISDDVGDHFSFDISGRGICKGAGLCIKDQRGRTAKYWFTSVTQPDNTVVSLLDRSKAFDGTSYTYSYRTSSGNLCKGFVSSWPCRVVSVRGRGGSVTVAYDSSDRVQAIGSGDVITSYLYDPNDRYEGLHADLVDINEAPEGTFTNNPFQTHLKTYVYLVSTNDTFISRVLEISNGSETSTSYDQYGAVLTSPSPTTLHEPAVFYNDDGTLDQIISGAHVAQFDWKDNRLSILRFDSSLLMFSYDERGKLQKISVNGDDKAMTLKYDPSGTMRFDGAPQTLTQVANVFSQVASLLPPGPAKTSILSLMAPLTRAISKPLNAAQAKALPSQP